MSMDRAEQAGIGVSVAGHAILVGLFALGLFAARPIEIPKRDAVEVSLVAEPALESGAPQLSQEAPAPKLAEVEAPIEPEPPAPTPEPVAKPTPKPVEPSKPVVTKKPAVPKPVTAKATPAKPAPAKAAPKAAAKAPSKAAETPAPARSGGRLTGLLKGLTADEGGRATAAPAVRITPAIQSSLGSEIMRQIKPHWSGPSGPDVDALKTVLKVSLARDGSVTDIQVVGTSGINDSNRSIAPIHKERAIKAVRLASPFRLPAQYYDGWKSVNVNFDWRLQ